MVPRCKRQEKPKYQENGLTRKLPDSHQWKYKAHHSCDYWLTYIQVNMIVYGMCVHADGVLDCCTEFCFIFSCLSLTSGCFASHCWRMSSPLRILYSTLLWSTGGFAANSAVAHVQHVYFGHNYCSCSVPMLYMEKHTVRGYCE